VYEFKYTVLILLVMFYIKSMIMKLQVVYKTLSYPALFCFMKQFKNLLKKIYYAKKRLVTLIDPRIQ